MLFFMNACHSTSLTTMLSQETWFKKLRVQCYLSRPELDSGLTMMLWTSMDV